ncbi:hypothetical protein [Microbacterium sp. SS28]|uniref:hypothetical protein n=1 Tax=Microbacterium sp. SS28 TaxID=2919948 RepID=UPI001FA966BE|nr:hypothetical protein [Microbacterium sp. SS28]
MDDARANNEPLEDPPTGTDQLAADGSPTGGDETTEEQLQADNPAEEETLKTLDPDAAPA